MAADTYDGPAGIGETAAAVCNKAEAAVEGGF